MTQPAVHAPRPAATARMFNVSLGYELVSLGSPSPSRMSLHGLDASLTMEMLPRFALKADIGYARGKVFSGLRSNVLTFLAGPVFYPIVSKHHAFYVQGLVGGARVVGVVDRPGDVGIVTDLAWAFGGGAEIPLSRSLALRVGAEYLHTTLLNSAFAFRGQGDLRATVSVAYFFGRSRLPRFRD